MPLIICLLTLASAKTTAENINPLSTYFKVNSIIQDHNDYIWFAGQNGLTRFDGKQVINFSSYNEKWTIPYTWIHNIIIEKKDFIITTESEQIWRFDPETGKNTKIDINLPNLSTKNTALYKREYFFNTDTNEIYKYSPSKKSTVLLLEDIDISHIKTSDNNLYIAGRSGLYKLEKNSFIPIIQEYVYSLSSLDKGILVITEKNIWYIGDDGSRNKIRNYGNYTVSAKSNDNQALLMNKKGITSKISIPYLKEINHKYPKIEPLIPKEILQDSSNTLWVSSNKGIIKISPSFIKDHHKTYNVLDNANEIEIFNNELVIGTYGDGIYSFNETDNGLSSKINHALTSLGKKTMDLLAIDNVLYIATFDGLWIYNRKNNSIKKAEFLNNNKILLKLTRKQNLLYIATNSYGVYIYNLATQRIINHIDITQGISSSEVIDIMTLDNHNIWLATANGINIYNIYTKKNKYINLPGKNKVISFATHNNKVYAATKGDGIFIMNFHGDVLSRIARGIDFSMISTIGNEIWAPARQGLYRINTDEDSISLVPNTEKYTFTDRPVNNENTIYIPHYKGILEVPLNKIEKYNPKVSISEITISGKSYLIHKNIEVNSENDVISLNLASLDFRSGKDKNFRYQINGGKWHNVFGSQLTLTGLQSGSYKLNIEGTNSLGQWSEINAFTQINVAYPWYFTPQMKAFYIFTVCFILIATAWLLYLRFHSIRNIHTILSNEIKSHGKITFNLERNLLQAKELLTDETNDINQENIHRVKHIVNECIDSLTQNDNESEPTSIQGKSLEIALPYLVNYAHQKYHSNINLQIDIPERRLNQEMQADIYKIIYETIISTLTNGGGRNFDITIQEFKQKMWLSITNDENDFSKFKNIINFDMSMYYIRQISSKYNASFNVFDKENSGSQLIISFPLMDIS